MRTATFLWLLTASTVWAPWCAAADVSKQPPLECVDATGKVTVSAKEIYRVDGVEVAAPRLIKSVQPVPLDPSYKGPRPSFLVFDGVIDKTGAFCALRLVKPEPSPFTDAYLAALRQWRYEPATRNGEPVAVYFTLSANIHYR